MNYEQQLLWIIPNGDYIDRNLEDGRPVFYPFVLGITDHRDRAAEFCKEYGLNNYPEGGSHNDWGKYFIERGFVVFFNSAVTIDNKYFGSFFLPNQLTINQIDFLESQKEMFYEKYDPTILKTVVKPDGDLEYKSSTGLRDLKIEAIINGKSTENGIDLFYDEINFQKERLNSIRK